MLNALLNRNIMPFKIQLKHKIVSFSKIVLGFWPILIVYYGISSIYPNFKFLMALYLAVLSKLIILELAVFFIAKKLPFDESLAIVLSVGYGINQIIRSVALITTRIINNQESWWIILHKYWIYLLLNGLLFAASYKAAYYLWHSCNYREIFRFIKLNLQIRINFIKQRLLLSVTGKVNRTLGASASKSLNIF